MGRITDPAVVHALGRLQIHRRQGNGVYQSVELLTLTDSDPTGYTRLARALRQMSLAGRINDAKLQGPQITAIIKVHPPTHSNGRIVPHKKSVWHR
jgi:hypothetical protein